mmetsp:Transcript_31385/g.69573  ORF Transcript_31385/g.69573 Transcript_31385/m.69573 type:complete len:233 (-) Transcript_31385:1502-2200(-)
MSIVLSGGKATNLIAGHNNRRRNIILHLNLVSRDKVLTELVCTPVAGILVKTDAKVGTDKCAAINLELVARSTIHFVDGEVRLPISLPLGLAETLDGENDSTDVIRNVLNVVIVLIGVKVVIGGKKVDHRAKGSVGRQDGTAGRTLLGLGVLLGEAVGIIAIDNLLNQVHVLLELSNVHGPIDDGIVETLGNLRLAATGYGRRLVAECSLSTGTDQTERGSLGMLQQTDLVT